MPLVSKMIRYPDEKKAMGILNNGPYDQQGVQESGYDSIKNTINDIHSFLVDDIGLTHTPFNGELDLNNIPDLLLNQEAKKSNVLNADEFLSYGFKMYSFNDELQNEAPIILKIYFGVKNISDKGSDIKFSSRFAFTISIDILVNNKIIYSFNPTQAFTNRSTGGVAFSAYYNYTEENLSKGFYSGDRLFLDLIPNRRVSYCSRSNVNTNKLFPYIKFYLERCDKFIKLKIFTTTKNYGYGDNNIWDLTSTNFIYKSIIEDSLYTTQENCFIPFLNKANITNNNYGVYRTIDIDPLTNITYENNNIMIGYSNQLINSNVEVDVNIEGINERFYVITPNIYDITYTFDPKIALLLRV